MSDDIKLFLPLFEEFDYYKERGWIAEKKTEEAKKVEEIFCLPPGSLQITPGEER